MKTTLAVAIHLAALAALTIQSAPGPTDPPARETVSQWFDRMNGLDGSEASVEALVTLYKEDALHITGPESHQLGAVTFSGHENLRTMVRQLTTRYANIQWRPQVVTAREKSETLYHEAAGPWGGESVALAYSASFTRREDGVRLMVPGAAFFQLEGGRIRQVRLYVASGEQAEVEPLK